MSYGLQPTHMEELRKRNPIRLYLEEQFVDILHVLSVTILAFIDFCGMFVTGSHEATTFVWANRRHTMLALFAIMTLTAMVW